MKRIKNKYVWSALAAIFTLSGFLAAPLAQTPTQPEATMTVAQAQAALAQAKVEAKSDFQSVIDCRRVSSPERSACSHERNAQIVAINRRLADAQKAVTKAQVAENREKADAEKASLRAQDEATQQAQRPAPAQNNQAGRPAPLFTPVPSQTARATPAAPSNPDVYDSKSFSGLTTWLDAFQKEASNPTDFAANLAKIKAAANGPTAKANIFVGVGQRNDLQKFLTDHQLYKGYYRSASALVELQNQCLVQRNYSAAETCDCVAGFPGDTTIGPGAGELVIQSNKTKAIAACGRAAELATDPHLKARFTAQRARAQVKTMDPAQAGQWADEAIAAGYRRATIVKASAGLQDIEVRSGGFPPMSEADYKSEVQYGVDALKAAKKAGVWETFIVAEQFQETMHNIAFTEAVLGPIVKSMLAPPPSSPCGQDSTGDDGRPIAGSGCIGHSLGSW
jgi:hypothetical protein